MTMQSGAARLARTDSQRDECQLAGLAPITASEALPGRGLKCWLACPANQLGQLLLQPVTPRPASLPDPSLPISRPSSRLAQGNVPGQATIAERAAKAIDATGIVAPAAEEAVEVRLAIGNRRLMQEEGVALSAQVWWLLEAVPPALEHGVRLSGHLVASQSAL
jgi:hypothetical protein